MVLLVGDIGGTNARLAFLDDINGTLKSPRIFNCKDFPNIEDLLYHYSKASNIKPLYLSLAVAGPVLDDTIKLTNGSWKFSKKELLGSFELSKAIFINDFTAQAYAQLPYFSDGYKIVKWEKSQKEPIGRLLKGSKNQSGPVLVLGPGTGLGVATLVIGNHKNIVLQGEGGQVHFTPRSNIEVELYRWMAKKTTDVSAEEFVSGRGLENIYRFLIEKENILTKSENGIPISAERIGEAALKGEKISIEAVKTMFGILGTVAANGALTNGSWGGIVIAGGITPKLIDLFWDSRFIRNFSSHAVYQELLNRISIYIFSDPLGGLRGAQIAFSQMTR